MDELTSVGHSPTEQYAANCRAMRAAGTGGGSRAFGEGGLGSNRCAVDDPEGTHSDHIRAGPCPDSVSANLEPSKWNRVETVTINVVNNGDVDDYDDDDDDDNEEEEEEEEEEEGEEEEEEEEDKEEEEEEEEEEEKEEEEEEDEEKEEEEESEEEEEVEMMEISEMNNNMSSISNTNGNNNVDEGESERGASTSEEGLLSASTISTASR